MPSLELSFSENIPKKVTGWTSFPNHHSFQPTTRKFQFAARRNPPFSPAEHPDTNKQL